MSTSTIDYTYNLGLISFVCFFLKQKKKKNWIIIILAPYISSIEPTNGPQEGGIAVTIRGNNLAKSREDIENVTLGGVVCRFPRLVNGNNGVLTCQSSSSLTPVFFFFPKKKTNKCFLNFFIYFRWVVLLLFKVIQEEFLKEIYILLSIHVLFIDFILKKGKKI